MAVVDLEFIHRFRDRHGKWRHYFRRGRRKRIPLPGAPGSAEFMAAYQAAHAGDVPPIAALRTTPGSMSALTISWYASSAFTGLAASSQKTYRRVLDAFLETHGHRAVRDLEPRYVRLLLEGKATTPAAANRLLSLLKQLMRHAIEREWRDTDPTVGVRKMRYKKDPHPQWSDEDIARFEAHWPLGTRARLALALLLYTGQRRGDVIRMGRQHIKDGRIEVTQQKTKTRLRIPIHGELRAALDACPSDHLTFLMTEQGKPFASGNAFYNWFTECTLAAGLPKGLSPHGLRKSIARRLVEAGCTPSQVQAITGHQTLAEVDRYTRGANQAELAVAAIGRISPGKNRR